MDQVWWYANGDKKIGAISLNELLQQLVSDQINLETLVWKQGWENWLKLRDAEEIHPQVLETIRAQQAKIPPPLPPSISGPTPIPHQLSSVSTAPSSSPANVSVVYAGFWERFAAGWIDCMVLLFSYIPYWIISAVKGQNHPSVLIGLLFAFIVSAIYFTKMESGESGASYGKRWVGIKVLDIQGNRISKSRAFTRWIAHFLSYITLYIGFLIQPFTVRKQALHDMVANTVIIQTKKARKSSWIIAAIPVGMAAILFIGIVAAIAIPAYHDYATNRRLAEAVAGDQIIDAPGIKFFDLGQFTVELLPEKKEGSLYLQTSITIKLDDPKLEQIIITNRPEILSKVNMLLQSKRPSELTTYVGKERLANDIKAQIEKTLGVSGVSDVLFTSFIIQ